MRLGKRFRLNDRVLHFDLSESNLRYENICRVILFSITWNTHWGGRDYCLNFPFEESEHIKIKCHIQSIIAESALKLKFKSSLRLCDFRQVTSLNLQLYEEKYLPCRL